MNYKDHFQFVRNCYNLTLLSTSLSISFCANAQLNMDNVAVSIGILHQYNTPSLYGGGVSFHDFDNDGWDDLSFATKGDSIHFYKNYSGVFQRVDLEIGVVGEVKQILWVDQDNDGDKDLFITQWDDKNYLFENDGSMGFTDITTSCGILWQDAPTFGASWGDVDNDGYLDLYITNRVGTISPYCNYLYKNNGDDTFTNITWSASVSDSLKNPFLAVFLDYDRNGDVDLYVPQDKFSGNTMFRNLGGNAFSDVSVLTSSDLVMNAMSGTVEDVDGNGFPDIYLTNTQPGNKFLINSGLGYFSEQAIAFGVEYGISDGWGANWFDLDNDGDLDLQMCGTEIALPDTQYSYYLQMNNGLFERPFLINSYDTARSFGSAIGDFNNDGRVDIAMNNEAPSYSMLIENNSIGGHWLKVDLEGTISNKDGVGGIIETWVNGNYQARYKLCGESYISQNSGTEFFGFGTDFLVDSLKVIWPSGMVDVEYDLDVDQRIKIIEGTGLLTTGISATTGPPELLRIFPQPVSDHLVFYWNTAAPMSIFVYDLTGKEMQLSFDLSAGRGECDVQELPNGMYLLRFTSLSGETLVKRFVKTSGL